MSPTILIVVAGLGLAGFAILFVALWSMRREGNKRKNTSPTRKKIAAGADNTTEELRVLRDRLTGGLLVEIDGQRYAKLSDVPDALVHQRLLDTLSALKTFSGDATVSTSEAPVGVASPASRAANPVTVASEAAAKTPIASRLASTSAPIQTPSMNPLKQMLVLREMAKVQPVQPLNITEQINDILQAMLKGTPLARRGIQVTAGAGSSVIFRADGLAYGTVDDVPDEEARAIIRAAVADWEQSQ
jgi:FtsZ-interacting cell division protein ZipA